VIRAIADHHRTRLVRVDVQTGEKFLDLFLLLLALQQQRLSIDLDLRNVISSSQK
jgi:hypothetical protein